jgi:hypothetical protein
MSLLKLTYFHAGFFLVLSVLFFIPHTMAATMEFKPPYYHKADNIRLGNDMTVRSSGYSSQSGVILARLSEEEVTAVSASAEPEIDEADNSGIQGDEEREVDFRKIASELGEERHSERYLYWYDNDGDSEGQISVRNSRRHGKYENITEDTKYMTLMHVAAAGVLYLMPESVTKWDKSSMSFSSVTDKWVENVTSAPVWDGDDWLLNYVGHPYQGAIYYVVARHSGFDWKGAFLYSTFCSTFIWEYGFEAFAETPSIQDLIITPVTGAVLGELLLQGEERILKNGGTVLGSKILGNISLFLIDPAGHTVSALKKVPGWPSGIRARTEFFYEPLSVYGAASPMDQLSDPDSRYGMRLVFTYQ